MPIFAAHPNSGEFSYDRERLTPDPCVRLATPALPGIRFAKPTRRGLSSSFTSLMSDHFSAAKLNRAAEACVRLCRNSHAPLALVAAFRDQLAADPAWDEEEIVAVERRVLELLRYLVIAD